MLEIGGSQIVTAACRSRRMRAPKPGGGVQNSLVCAAQRGVTGSGDGTCVMGGLPVG
jgi:hypothetical protein